MTLNLTTKLVLSSLIGSMLVLGTGCQSGGFKPDLGRLAFWKKDEVQLASNVPPPSEHFSPDRGNSKGVAEANKQNLKDSVDAIIAEAKRNKTIPKDPTRKPYSLDPIDSKIGSSTKSGNDFVSNNSFQNFKSSASKAVKSTQDAVKQAGDLVRNPGQVMSEFQQQSQHAASQIASGVSEGLTKQANNVVSGAASTASDYLNAATNKVQQTVNTVQERVDNSFQPQSGSAGSGVKRNPYLGSLNNATNNFVSSKAQAAAASTEKIGKAVNDIVVPDNQSPKYQTVSASTANQGSATKTANLQMANPSSQRSPSTGALQPLQKNSSHTTSVNASGQNANGYPSTSFGAIRPLQRSTTTSSPSTLPASLLKTSSNFTPGSTKPLQPLR